MSIEKPILFSGPMVKAILDGRKSQTRRIVKPQPNEDGIADDTEPCPPYPRRWMGSCGNEWKCPYPVGTLLWVRECFQTGDYAQNEPRGYVYRATDPDWKTMEGWKWKPSIFMPRAASRITLEVTGVRVERLQHISDDDCIAEGCIGDEVDGADQPLPTMCFQSLWQSINGPESWEKNPWVWVIQFKKL